jgi:hypothetical protein
MISKETAMGIALAYREVETAEKLLAEIRKEIRPPEAPDLRDSFGIRVRSLQLGVPNGETSRRLFDVQWALAEPVIEAHIAHHRSVIVALCEKARAELVSGFVP